jgi:hypothetical protein
MDTSKISAYQNVGLIEQIKEKNSQIEKSIATTPKKDEFISELKQSIETLFSPKEVGQVLSSKEKEMLIELFEKKALELSPDYNKKFSSPNNSLPVGGKLDVLA